MCNVMKEKLKIPYIKKKGNNTLFIVIRKASTFFGRITIADNEQNGVILDAADKLIFTVRQSLKENPGDAKIKKIITADHEFEGGYGFELTPEETNLPIGTYYYDVGLQRENGEFYHITVPDEFIIKQSMSRKED